MAQDINTPKYNRVTGLLTDYGRSLGLKEVNKPSSTISVDTLQGSPTPVKLPTQTPTIPPTISMTDTTSPELKAEREKLMAQKSSQETGISSLMTSLGIEQGKEAQYATEAGADLAQQEYDRYSSELTQEQRNLENAKRNILRNNPTGALRGGQADLLANMERDSLQKQADIAILGNAAKGRFDTALDIAKRKVESAVAPLKAELDAKKFIYENNKDLFNKAELSKLDTLIKSDERKIAKEENDKMKGEEMIINALALKAPQNIIQNAKDILNKTGDKLKVAQSLGKYYRDMDMELKDAQIAKAWSDAKKSDTTSGVLTEQQIKQIDTSPQGKKLVSLSGLYQKSQTYKNLVDTYGFKATGAEKALLDSAYADLKIAYKEAANLGALTGPDVLLIEEAIKPSSGALNYFNYQLSGGKEGVSGAIDSALGKARKEALQNYKQLTARNPGYASSDYVNQLITPFAKDYNTINIDTVPAGEIIQTEDGLLLESLGNGQFSPL